jgi:hypothetical protein
MSWKMLQLGINLKGEIKSWELDYPPNQTKEKIRLYQQ